MSDISNKLISELLERIESAENELRRARNAIRRIEEEKVASYKLIPGVEGMFDGFNMITESGGKFEVPANYAAKSRLIYGDVLKKIEEDGKTLFKQISKKERKKLDGVLNKKEGMWHVLTDVGTYKVSETAAEFAGAGVGDKVTVLVPIDNTNVPFAALDKVVKERVDTIQPPRAPIGSPPAVVKPIAKKPVAVAKPKVVAPAVVRPRISVVAPKPAATTAPIAPVPAPEVKKQSVDSIRDLNLGDDDLR